jgi:hypothetical protein
MKKVFLVCTLAGLVAMTSCSKDDDSVALTGITVNPTSINAPVGNNVRVTAKANPENATGVSYSWASANASVATVDQTGLVSIVGVGTTTVTVSSGTFTATVNVEGTIESIAVKDEAGGVAKAYDYNGQPVPFQLTATISPAGLSGIVPVWSVNSASVTVTPAADGLSAAVVIVGEGEAVITAAVGEKTATYTVSTESVFESAIGYWTFDDPANLGKATRGVDLTFDPATVESVPGPSETNKAVYVKEGYVISKEHGVPSNGFIWDHPFKEETTTYTILIDARVPQVEDNLYFGIFRTNFNDGERAQSLDFRTRNGRTLTINRVGGTLGNVIKPENTPEHGNEPWVRIVVRYSPLETPIEGKDHDHNIYATVNGGLEEPIYNSTQNKIWYTKIYPQYPVRFLTGTPSHEKCNYSASTIAVWDRWLTDAEVASLGGVSK